MNKEVYRLYDYEVYGDAETGYEVNDVFGTEFYYELSGDESFAEIAKMVDIREDIELDNDVSNDMHFEFIEKETGKPIGCLRAKPGSEFWRFSNKRLWPLFKQKTK